MNNRKAKKLARKADFRQAMHEVKQMVGLSVEELERAGFRVTRFDHPPQITDKHEENKP